jgi:SAM-dependent methyltransferase
MILAMPAIYDAIGKVYSGKRQADPRIALAIEQALGRCASVLNVGAGTGSYEPRGCNVVAVEPSGTMIRQRAVNVVPVVQARAEALPFADRSFDAVLGILTLHHWTDQAAGIAECLRVTRDRVVFLTVDPESLDGFWLFEYLPGLWALDRHLFSNADALARVFGSIDVVPVLIPADCRDGFLGAYWRRPSAYLDPLVRQCISIFSKIAAPEMEAGLTRLRIDIESGAWAKRYAAIADKDALDLGYRLVIGRRGASGVP